MPLAITTPPGFDLGAFTERVLRIGGMSPSAARTFSAQMAAAPFALFAISPDEEVTMRQVRLRTGKGTIVHDLNDDGSLQRTTLVWSTEDRLYVISSNLSDDEVIAIANAIPASESSLPESECVLASWRLTISSTADRSSVPCPTAASARSSRSRAAGGP